MVHLAICLEELAGSHKLIPQELHGLHGLAAGALCYRISWPLMDIGGFAAHATKQPVQIRGRNLGAGYAPVTSVIRLEHQR